MAFVTHSLWCVVFTVPADDHRFKHVISHNGTGDEARVREHMKRKNPDLRVVSAEKYTDPQFVLDRVAAVMREGGPEYRPLQGGEHRLTARQVRALRGQSEPEPQGLVDAAGVPLTVAERIAEATAGLAIPDPRG